MILENKLIEIRDTATTIEALAIRLQSDNSPEAFLLRRAGYGRGDSDYILLCRISGGDTNMNYDPFRWEARRGRTMHEAHKILIEKWDSFKSGDVLDVEFELGETTTKKVSEAVGFPDE